MMEIIAQDIRRIILGLLFVVAFGWTAALVFQGVNADKQAAWSLTAMGETVMNELG